MSVKKPNVLYLHSHDTGRFIQPYGHQVPTPNIQRLADQGLLFRTAFCAAPTCSGSRSALLTGQFPHSNGMMGLAHRGFELYDYGHHLVHTLRAAGYWSGLVGEQHLSRDPGVLGYDHVVDIGTTHVEQVVPATVALLADAPPAAVLPVGRLLRDPPRVLRADVGARRAVLAAARQPARHAGDAPRHGLLQGQRALAGPGRRLRAERARRARPRRRHARDPHHRPRARVPGRQGDAVRPRDRRAADHARPRRLPRRARLQRAGLPGRPVPDRVRAGRDRPRRTGCRAPRCCRCCAGRPTRSTRPCSPS